MHDIAESFFYSFPCLRSLEIIAMYRLYVVNIYSKSIKYTKFIVILVILELS